MGKPRTQIENRIFRRDSLIEAAIKAVAEHDIHGATVERICNLAGASRGLIAHYFDSKEELLIAALKSVFDHAMEIKRTIAAETETSARDRLCRIAASSYLSPVYRWEYAAAWQSYQNIARSSDVYRAPLDALAEDYRKLLTPLFEEAAQDAGVRIEADIAVSGLLAFNDGLWSNLVIDRLSEDNAIRLTELYIDACLGMQS